MNHDGTLTSRLNAIEIMPLSFQEGGPPLRFALQKLLADTSLDDQDLVAENEFIKILIHASAYRFGVVIELMIEAIGEAGGDEDGVLGLEHFSAAYHRRMHCDDKLNPFDSVRRKAIDTTMAVQRYMDEKKGRPVAKRRK